MHRHGVAQGRRGGDGSERAAGLAQAAEISDECRDERCGEVVAVQLDDDRRAAAAVAQDPIDGARERSGRVRVVHRQWDAKGRRSSSSSSAARMIGSLPDLLRRA